MTASYSVFFSVFYTPFHWKPDPTDSPSWNAKECDCVDFPSSAMALGGRATGPPQEDPSRSPPRRQRYKGNEVKQEAWIYFQDRIDSEINKAF